MLLRLTALVALLLCLAPAAHAVTADGPEGRVGPFPAFRITLGAGESGPRPTLYRTADTSQGGTDLTVRETPQGMRPYLPLEPGRQWWTGSAYSGSQRVQSAAREIRVRNATDLSRAVFLRERATVNGHYVWRTNAAALTHRVDVFHEGKRVSEQVSRIRHSESTRMAGETWQFRAALTDNKPPFGSVHPGIWKVRVTIKGAGRRDSATKRYRIG